MDDMTLPTAPWNEQSLTQFRCESCGYMIFPLRGFEPASPPTCPACQEEMEELIDTNFRIGEDE